MPDGNNRSPSPAPYCNFANQMWEPITRGDIERCLEYHAICCNNLMEIGFDGIDVHNHSGTVAGFLSASINKRTDEYGGLL